MSERIPYPFGYFDGPELDDSNECEYCGAEMKLSTDYCENDECETNVTTEEKAVC